MISIPPSVVKAFFAVASPRVSRRPRTQRMLVFLLTFLVVLLGAVRVTSAQTAHFSGAMSMSPVGSGFDYPAGMATDGNGNLYVADFENNAVKEILAVNGSIPPTPTIITLGSGFINPMAVTVDGSGNVYVADTGNLAVKEILAINGSIPATPTIRTLITVGSPVYGIAVDDNGNVYFSPGVPLQSLGMSNNTVKQSLAISSTGGNNPVEELLAVNGSIPASPIVVSFNDFVQASGLALDSHGDVYVGDSESNILYEILAINGKVSASSAIRTVASFTRPTGPIGLAVDSSGNVYVADPVDNSVYEILAVDGSIPASPTIETIGTNFNGPTGVAVDGHGSIYVADSGNNRVVMLSSGIGNFGSVNIGTTSAAIPMYFTFDTAGTLGSIAVLTQGATGLDFANAGTGSCKANSTYAAGQTCTVNVAFTPRLAGTRNGTTVLYNTSGIPIASGNLQGVGMGPQIDFFPGTTTPVATIGSPQGMTIDNSGNVYVASASGIYEMQAQNGSIPASPHITTITSTGSGYYSVAVDANGNLYTANGNSVMQIQAVNGIIPPSPVIFPLYSGFSNLQYVAVDRSGNVYVSDSVNSAVKEILPFNGSNPNTPTIVTLATEPGCAIGPLAVDGNGNVFFICGESLMEIVAVNGSIPVSPVIRTLASDGAFNGIAIDASGNVYESSATSGTVQELLAVNGSVPGSPYVFPLGEGFIWAAGVAVDGNGNVYFTETSNNSVVKLNPSTPPSLIFAPTPVGTTSSGGPQLIAVTNVGNALLNFPTPSTGNNPSIGANFSLSSSSSCPLLTPGSYQPGMLAPGTSCLMFVNFVPTATGTLSGTLAITDNNLNAAAPAYATQSIALSGTGLANFYLMTPPPVTVIQGASATDTILAGPPGFTGNVNLAAPGLPNGVTASFTPNPTTGASVLTLTASSTAVSGTVTITGTFGTQTASTSFLLTVKPPPSFTLMAPTAMTIIQGASSTASVQVVPGSGFGGSVNLSISGMPSGVSAFLTPNPTTGSSVLTLAASNNSNLGSTSLTITGTSGTLTETATLQLTVNPLQVTAPLPLNFGQVNINNASSASPAVFTFVYGGTFGSIAVLTQGAAGLDFTDAGSDTCVANTVYAVGQSCTVNVIFTPKFAGSRYGAVVLYDNNGNAIATGYLQGTGIGPQINFLPGSQTTLGSGFNYASGIAVDGSGNAYVVDLLNNLGNVQEILAVNGSIPANPTVKTLVAGLGCPSGPALDAAGNLYYIDGCYHTVNEIQMVNGMPASPSVRTLTSQFTEPEGITVDGNGNVYILDASDNSVNEIVAVNGVIPASPTITTLASGFAELDGIGVDGNGSVYVSDDKSRQVFEIHAVKGSIPASPLITSLASGFVIPRGIAVDYNGNVYVAEYAYGTVEKILAVNGVIPASPTIATLGSGLLYANGVALDGSGNVFVADYGDGRVVRLDYADPPSLSFASTAVGSASTDSPQTVTVENVGNAALSFPVPTNASNPSIGANFTLNSGGSSACPLLISGSSTAGTLAAGASCQLPINFTPTTAGTLNGSLALMDNNLNAAAPVYATQSILLSGTATQATPTINWATPAAIIYGTPLSAAQLNATASMAGTFTYSPAAATVLGAGQQTLTVTLSPTDSTDYTPATASVNLTVNQASPIITCATPAPIVYGTPISATMLGCSANVAGTFAYTPAIGTVPTAGSNLISIAFTPTDTTDYTIALASVTLTVTAAAPTLSWATPAAITYGAPLSAIQLSASANVAGTFTYSPAVGTVLTAGQQTLTATFSPTDSTDYATASASVVLTVNKATSTISWATPAAITYGAPLSATQLNASSNVAGSFTYSPTAGNVLTAGQQTLTVTFSPTNSTDYTTATGNVTLTVNKATPTVTWATPTAITYGTTLSGTQLNAKASVPGALVYSPAAGSVPAVGTDTLTVTFTPTDITDYTTATDSVLLKVNPAPSFTLGVSPAALSLAQGASGKSTIAVTGQNGFTGSVTLTASGLPSGVTASYATNPTTGSSVLTLTASGSATVGSATITVKGTSGSLTASTTIALTISCTPTTITPYISINGGSTWMEESSATVNSPSTVVDLGPQPLSGGSWNWAGPNKYASTSRQINGIPLTVGTDSYVATYTNASGCKSTGTFTITVK